MAPALEHESSWRCGEQRAARLQHNFGDLQADEEGTSDNFGPLDIMHSAISACHATDVGSELFFFSNAAVAFWSNHNSTTSQVLWVRQRTNGLHAFKCIPVYMDYQAGCGQ